MPTYTYPEARELREIGPELVAQETANDVLFQLFPIREVNEAIMQWTIEDNDRGLQGLRGLDGAPGRVTRLGKNTYSSEPGYFGEFETITERELTLRGGSVVSPNAVVNVEDLVMSLFRQLVRREVARMRWILATLLTTGTFSVSNKDGAVTFTDTFTLQTLAASDWSTPSTATPLGDFRTLQQKGTGKGVTFGSGAKAIGNRVTINRMLANTNAADLGGRRTTGGGTINSVAETNKITMGEDLPQVVIYDDGYVDANGTFQKFFADDIVVAVGVRDEGDIIGEYRLTRNLNNPDGAPGSYEYIKDYAQGINAPKETPPKIEVHRGHNGGPVIYRPNGVVVVSC